MRIGIITLQHESNTFISTPTTIRDFKRDILAWGPKVRDLFGPAHHEVGGFYEVLEHEGAEPVSIFAARAVPSGALTAEAYDELCRILFEQVAGAGALEGLLVAPHGAAVCQSQRDMDGHWLTLLRERIGPDVPMVCTLDAHANLSPRMIEACDATIVYRSNPHLDQRQRGREAAGLILRTIRGEVKPTQAASAPPIAINIERQHTSSWPCLPLYELADQMLHREGVLSNSVVLGFPYADVREMGSAFVVVTDNAPDAAQALADELAGYLVEHRQDFVGQLTDIESAVQEACDSEGPVCLLDMGDNVGGGAAADGTVLAREIHRRGGPRTFVCLCDPDAVEAAKSAGVGRVVTLAMGGKTDDLHGPPLEAEVTVCSLHPGRFHETKPRHGGATTYDMGPTAVVQTDAGLVIQLTSQRTKPFSLNQLTSCDLDPRSFQILIAKGVQAPVAAYEAVCTKIIRVNTPGVTSADLSTFQYEHRRRPLFPFEEIGSA